MNTEEIKNMEFSGETDKIQQFINNYKSNVPGVSLGEEREQRIWKHIMDTHREVSKEKVSIFSFDAIKNFIMFLVSPPVLRQAAVFGSVIIVSAILFLILYNKTGDYQKRNQYFASRHLDKKLQNIDKEQTSPVEKTTEKPEEKNVDIVPSSEFLAKFNENDIKPESFGFAPAEPFDSLLIKRFTENFSKITNKKIHFDYLNKRFTSNWFLLSNKKESELSKFRFIISIDKAGEEASIIVETMVQSNKNESLQSVSSGTYKSFINTLKRKKI